MSLTKYNQKRKFDVIPSRGVSSRLTGSIKKTVNIDSLISQDWLNAQKEPMPKEIKPMLATLVEEPFDKKDWIYEIKWDGYRAIAEKEKNSVRLYSRNNQEFNHKYPLIVKELQNIPYDVILDGEVVVVDETGNTRFQYLLH